MKSYQVILSDLALADLEEAYAWSVKHAGPAIDAWLRRLRADLNKLSKSPERFAPARESQRTNIPLRETYFGKRGSQVFRIIFTIEPERVVVLRIRRGTRRSLAKRELEDLG